MNKLKPCPFCGGKPFAYPSGSPSNGNFKEVICVRCGCRTDRFRDEKAVEVWNRRADNGEAD